MTMNSRFAVVLAAAICIPGAIAPAAAAPVSYTSAWFLGDSLSDNGNLYDMSQNLGLSVPIPPPPYWEGRFSNGQVWADHIAKDFTDKGLATGNFAYGFATAVHVDPNPYRPPLPIPDLPQQIAAFKAVDASRLGARPLVSLFFGANDIFQAIEAAGEQGFTDLAQYFTYVGVKAMAAASAVVKEIEDLSGQGFKDFLVFKLPPLDQTPALSSDPLASLLAEQGTLAFNATLAAGLSGRSGITTIDMPALFDWLINRPGDFGLTNVKDACFDQGPPPILPYCATPDTFAFWDTVHPNQVVHAALADEVRRFVAPVPLPLPGLLLAGGVVMLAAVRRRARG